MMKSIRDDSASSQSKIAFSSGKSRRKQERLIRGIFFVASALPLITAIVILVALCVRASPILEGRSIAQLLSGRTWRPISGEFGFYPFIVGTMWVTVVAMVLAIPVCLLTAIYLSEYAHAFVRSLMKPLLDLLAAIPSVVYGVWGMLVIVPWVENYIAPFFKRFFGYVPFFMSRNPTGFGVLAGGVVLAIMVIPFIVSVVYEVFQAVPEGLREASLAVGATKWETVKYAVIPATLPGIVAAIVLGSSRALGETMAVLMVVGNVVQIPKSIFDAAYPLPALIANNYGEMLSIPMYDAALLAAALILLLVVLIFNILATWILRQFLKR